MLWAAPQVETDFTGQASIVEDFINRRVAAIVLAPAHQSALVSVAERAIDAGIPVVIMDSGLESTRPVSYVATDNYQGGVLAAREMARASCAPLAHSPVVSDARRRPARRSGPVLFVDRAFE